MWSIEPHREEIVKYSVTVTLDEDEITKILVNPKDFLAQLRSIRAQWHRGASWAATGHASLNGHKPRKVVAKNAAGKRLWRCPKCHKFFRSPGRHLAACRGEKDPLARSALPVDE